MNEREQKLKLALARMLPEKLLITDYVGIPIHHQWLGLEEPTVFKSLRFRLAGQQEEVKDTEWLHVCWLIANQMGMGQVVEYRKLINPLSPWQDCAEAICKVKGVEI